MTTEKTEPYFMKLHKNDPSRREQHQHFGGTIYLADFYTGVCMSGQNYSSMAARIEKDFRWERKLLIGKKNLQAYRKGGYKRND